MREVLNREAKTECELTAVVQQLSYGRFPVEDPQTAREASFYLGKGRLGHIKKREWGYGRDSEKYPKPDTI